MCVHVVLRLFLCSVTVALLCSAAVCLERLDGSVSGLLTTICNHTFHCSVPSTPHPFAVAALAAYVLVCLHVFACVWLCGLAWCGVYFAVPEELAGLVVPRVSILPERGGREADVRGLRPRGRAVDVPHLRPRRLRSLRGRARRRALPTYKPRVQVHACTTVCCEVLRCACPAVMLVTPRGVARVRGSMELQSQRVWDYVGDGYVHRLIQNARDGKLVELPDPRLRSEGERSQVRRCARCA